MEKFNKYLDVFKYVYNRREEDVKIDGKFGLKLGILLWPTITGEAQSILKLGMPKKSKTPLQLEIETNFFTPNNQKATEWISRAPVSLAGEFTSGYVQEFTRLVEASVKAQVSLIEKTFKPKWTSLLKILPVTEENAKAMLLARVLNEDLTKEDINNLAILYYNNKEEFINKLNNTTFTNLYLTPTIKHLPGRTLELQKTFPWLFNEH